jgi:hypothetical protein
MPSCTSPVGVITTTLTSAARSVLAMIVRRLRAKRRSAAVLPAVAFSARNAASRSTELLTVGAFWCRSCRAASVDV